MNTKVLNFNYWDPTIMSLLHCVPTTFSAKSAPTLIRTECRPSLWSGSCRTVACSFYFALVWLLLPARVKKLCIRSIHTIQRQAMREIFLFLEIIQIQKVRERIKSISCQKRAGIFSTFYHLSTIVYSWCSLYNNQPYECKNRYTVKLSYLAHFKVISNTFLTFQYCKYYWSKCCIKLF
jgi:hypothetical protein